MKQIEKLSCIIAETITEAMDKKKWFAFLNNGFETIDVIVKHQELYEEVKAIKNEPTKIEALQNKVIERFPQMDKEKGTKAFQIIWGAILYNVSASIEIAEIFKK